MFSSSGATPSISRRLFTTDSKELQNARNKLLEVIRDDVDWLIVENILTPEELLRDVKGGLLINGQEFLHSPEFTNIQNQNKDNELLALKAFIKRELFSKSKNQEKSNDETIENIFKYWSQSLFSTATIALNGSITEMIDRGMLRHESTTRPYYLANLQRAKNGIVYVETLTTCLTIISPHDMRKYIIPGAYIITLELTESGFKLTSIEASNPLVATLILNSIGNITDQNAIFAAINTEIAELEACPDEQLKEKAKLIADYVMCLLGEKSFNAYEVTALLCGILSVTKLITQIPNNKTLYFALYKMIVNVNGLAELKDYINDLTQGYHLGSSFYTKPLWEKDDFMVEKWQMPQRKSPFRLSTLAFVLASVAVVSLIVAAFIAFTFLTSGAALPLFIATGHTAFSLLGFTGAAITASKAAAFGACLFVSATALATTLTAYVAKKIASGLASLFVKKKSLAEKTSFKSITPPSSNATTLDLLQEQAPPPSIRSNRRPGHANQQAPTAAPPKSSYRNRSFFYCLPRKTRTREGCSINCANNVVSPTKTGIG